MTDLATLEASWDQAARDDAMFNIVTLPDKAQGGWTDADFFRHGQDEIDAAVLHLREIGVMPVQGRALDFGCGVGRLTRALAYYFDRVDGVDASGEMVARARRHHLGVACFFHHNAKPHLGIFDAGKFDLVYSMITLQHMNQKLQQGYVAEFLRVLKPDGVAMFHIPDGPDVGSTGWHLSMYGTRPQKVNRWILKAGGTLVDREDLGQDNLWRNYRYTVTR